MADDNDNRPDIFSLAEQAARRFRASLADRPQHPDQTYAALKARYDLPVPDNGASPEDTIAELIALAEPGLHLYVGARFFAWVIGASHPVGVAADWLTSAWGQNVGNHTAAPSAAVLEEVAAHWLLDLLHLPATASVGFVTGGTMANFTCLAAARSAVLERAGWDVEADGLYGAPPVHVVIGDDAHTTVFSALRMLGLGQNRAIRVPTDDQGRMEIDAFRKAIAGLDGPIIAVTQAGQINTGAFDPVAGIVDALEGRNAWVHVDGAFGLWARACPEKAALANGIDRADSWATDGHKWLQTPYDTGYAIVAHPDAHRRAVTSEASYLPPADLTDRDPSHFVPELSRRARGFPTWAMLRHLGREGVAAMVARHCRLARKFAELLAAEDGIHILNDVVLNQVTVRFGAAEPGEAADALTRETIALIQDDAVCFAGGASWKGRWILRLSVISWPTQDDDVKQAAQSIIGAWRKVRDQR